MTRVGLIGPGRVGSALAGLLPKEQFRLGPVMARNLTSARRAVRLLGCGSPAESFEAFHDCAVVLIAVPETQIAEVAHRLAQARRSFARQAALHTGELRDSQELSALAQRGAAVGSMCPLFVFQRQPLNLQGVHFTVEGDAAAVNMARRLIRAWKAEFELVKREHKIHHALARSIASDLLTGLLDVAVERMTAGGFSRRRGLAALIRLIRISVDNYERSGRTTRPGRLLQGDAGSLRYHLQMLRQIDPAAASRYQLLARETLEHLAKEDARFSFLDDDSDGGYRPFSYAAGRGGF